MIINFCHYTHTKLQIKDPKTGETPKYPKGESTTVPRKQVHRPQFQTTGKSLASYGISTATYFIHIVLLYVILLV